MFSLPELNNILSMPQSAIVLLIVIGTTGIGVITQRIVLWLLLCIGGYNSKRVKWVKIDYNIAF